MNKLFPYNCECERLGFQKIQQAVFSSWMPAHQDPGTATDWDAYHSIGRGYANRTLTEPTAYIRTS